MVISTTTLGVIRVMRIVNYLHPLDSPFNRRVDNKNNPSKAVVLLLTMTFQLTVPDMACSACVETISEAIAAIDPAAKVEADTKTKQVNVETQKPELEIKQAIVAAGYTIA